MGNLDSMLNIGKELETKLFSIGVSSSDELIRIGSKEVFRQFKERYSNVCLVHLYALQAAIDHIDYNKLSDELNLI